MKVYLFYNEFYNDGELVARGVGVFDSLEKAKSAFNAWHKENLEYAERKGWVITDYCDVYFCAYPKGEYSITHTYGDVFEREVK